MPTTDYLMEQVRVMLEDRNVHPASPIIVAGAALEAALRSAVDELQLALTEDPSINAYAQRLQQAGVLSRQDIRDYEQMSGVRNFAVYGSFDELGRFGDESRDRARRFEQQVDFLLGRLSKALEAARGTDPSQ